MALHGSTQADLLAMALVGYEREKAKIEATIADIRAQLGVRGRGRPKSATTISKEGPPGKRTLSASARQRIAAAQRKRWAAIKGKAGAETAKPKRKLSAAGRRAIIEATKKRWAAFHKAGKAKKTEAKAPKKAATSSAATAS